MAYRDFSKGFATGFMEVRPGVWGGYMVALRVGDDGEPDLARGHRDAWDLREGNPSQDMAYTAWIYNQADEPTSKQRCDVNECRFMGETLNLTGLDTAAMLDWFDTIAAKHAA